MFISNHISILIINMFIIIIITIMIGSEWGKFRE